MEKKVELGMLCEIYGKLLTDRQFNILNDYSNSDLSLSEIAENNNITRQAVNDIVKKSKLKLLAYEKQLGIMEKNIHTDQCIKKVLIQLDKINLESNANNKKLTKIKKELDNLTLK